MSDIRARVFSSVTTIDLYCSVSRTPVARASRRHWHLQVLKGDVVVNEDDCADFVSLLADAEQRVIRYRGMHADGVRLRPWSELVEEAEL